MASRNSYCRSCGAAVVWATTLGGKRIQLDIDSVPPEQRGDRALVFDYQKHRAHFATCPQAKQWRKR